MAHSYPSQDQFVHPLGIATVNVLIEMTAAVEVERCSPGVTAVQMHFADLDIKKTSIQPTPPSTTVRIESNPIPPPAEELAERLAELEKRPQTPPKDARPVPSPLGKNNNKAADSAERHQDSGYASIASSPEGLEPEKSQQTGFSSSKLRVFDRPIPEYLQHRFYDLKVLYSEDLLKAVYKKNVDQKDLSMKLKYLGKSEPSAQLYIVVQCEAKYAKKVKKFFAQSIVQDYLGNEFKLHVINRAPRALASSEEIKVYGENGWAMNTLCGQPVMLSNGELSMFATIGGILQVSKASDDDPQLYGFTAAHSLIPLLATGVARSLADDVSESSDDNDDDDDDDDDDFEEDDEILFDMPNDDELEAEEKPFKIQNAGILGTIVADSVEMPYNRDWSLVSLPQESWLPNLLSAQASSKGTKEVAIYFSNASLPFSYSAGVTAVTSRGPQHGRLETNKSFLFSSPGTELIQTFDLKLDPDYMLRPGDSGSWVVDPSSGRILGHIASIDAFGEAFVVPIQDTLGDIREILDAACVTIPSKAEIEKVRSTATRQESLAPAAHQPTASSKTIFSLPPDMGQHRQDADLSPTSFELSHNAVVPISAFPSSIQLGKPGEELTSAPSEPGKSSNQIPSPEGKKESLKKSSKSRFGDMMHVAKRLLSKPITKPATKPTMEPNVQHPIANYIFPAVTHVSHTPGMPYYHNEMKDTHYMSNSEGRNPWVYPHMYPMGPPPVAPVGMYEMSSPAKAPAGMYPSPEYKASGHDSGYSSLQPSAQCSPAPSPPSPGQRESP